MNRLNQIFLGFAVFIVVWSCTSPENSGDENLTVVFYNVENLFDTEDDPRKNDDEFTPQSEKKWDKTRYNKKLEDIAKVIAGINKNDLPEIVGLCEVENKKVLNDLVKTGLLANGNYKMVHQESRDHRGIDCALIYRPDEFTVSDYYTVPVHFEDDPGYTTRDILYVKGQTGNQEEFHIFVNHWPSRSGGLAQTEPKRLKAAVILKAKLDLVMAAEPNAHIIVMGDLNDEPDNKSLLEIIEAQPPSASGAKLINLMYPDFEKGRGSYNFRGNWDMLDNLIVSSGLLDDEGFRVVNDRGFIYQKPWMEYRNSDGEVSPNRTYGGPNYYGGVSDHFPVCFTLKRDSENHNFY